ncbi:tetratricopeptide repeat protein [candidate division WOR-3 bacterium]|nr:tetratricopeptide repeat protein [candidate division WOR-3 bacterium]
MISDRPAKFLLCGVLILGALGWSDVGASMRRGNRLERKGEYAEALRHYQEALVQEPDNPKIHYNIGRVLYRMQEYDEAISEFQLGFLEKDMGFHADIFYNIGNSQFRKGQLDAAIEAYRMSLLVDPKDLDAKQNLEFCLKVKKQIENQAQSDSTGQDEQQEQPRPEPQEGEISGEEAERILQALQDKEKEDLEKSRRQESKGDVDKDW